MKHVAGQRDGSFCQHFVEEELLEWLVSLYSEDSNQEELSNWNKLLAKFNLLFPSSPQALSEQESIIDFLILNSESQDGFQSDNFLSFHLNLLFNPLMAMKVDDGMCLHDFRANFSFPYIKQFNFPKIVGLANANGNDLYSSLTSDSILNLFSTQRSLPEYIETIFKVWNEQKQVGKKTYSSYSWAPLERKINILMNNGDEESISIPEPPMDMENSTDSLREKTWRIRNLENGDIDCFLSSDESIMQVDYFCKLLEKYTNLESNYIQHLLLIESGHKTSQFNKWISHIHDRIPDSTNVSNWSSLIECIVSYCFGECNDTFKYLIGELDHYRARLFNSREDEISIVEITPEIINSVFSMEEKEYLELLLAKFNNILKSNTIGGCTINLSNWISIALLYDLYRAEQASFFGCECLSNIWKSIQTKFSAIDGQIPFTFSPIFSMVLLATRSYSNNNSILKPNTIDDMEISRKLSLPSNYYEMLKECKVNKGIDIFVRGAKMDYIFSNIIKNFCEITTHLEINEKVIQSMYQRLISKSFKEILRENLGRDEDLDFLFTLLIIIVKDRLHMQPMNSIPKFAAKPPFIYYSVMVTPFQTTLAHPILFNRNIAKARFWYPLLINSKHNTKFIVSVNDQLEKRNVKHYFSNLNGLLYDRLTSIQVSLTEKIYLIRFVLCNKFFKDCLNKEDNIKKLITDIQELRLNKDI